MTDKKVLIYINGKIVPEDEATISVFDHGFIYGDGAFEGIAVREHKTFKLNEHVDRLYRTCKYLMIDIPLSKNEMKEAILETLRKNPDEVTYVRPIVTRGVGPLGIKASKKCLGPTIVIIPQIRKYPEEYYEKGMKVKITSTRRTPPQCLDPRGKVLNYLNNIMAMFEAESIGLDDGIMLDINGFVSEGTGANLFILKDKVLYTPSVTNNLEGIARATIIGVAKKEGFSIVEGKLTPYDLYNADEIFMTGSLGGARSVIEVDGRKIGEGKPGPVAKMLMKKYVEDCLKTGTPY